MSSFLITFLLLALLLFFVNLHKTYQHLPIKELRRRARAGNKTAGALYRVSIYGIGFDLFIWLAIGITGGILFSFLASKYGFLSATLSSAAVTWLAFSIVPNTKVSKLSENMAALLAAPISKVLSWIQPISSRADGLHRKISSKHTHSGLFEKEDLLELLHAQITQPDNRISQQELTIARGALTFGDKSVAGVMTPRRMVKFVGPQDNIGPHLMDELHKSGFSRFPVVTKEDNAEKIIGTLYLKDVIGRHEGGSVEQAMNREVYYINEQQSLLQALNAFVKNKHHLFVVVNNFEEITGVLTIEDVLEQIIGKDIVDEFDEHENLREVALASAQKEHKKEKHAVDTEPKPESEHEEPPKSEDTVVE